MTSHLLPWHLTEKARAALAAEAINPAPRYRGDAVEPQKPATTPAAASQHLTDERVDAYADLRALLADLPDAPWRVSLSHPGPGVRTAAGWEVVHASYDDHLSALEFVAAARNRLPDLLDERDRYREHSITLNTVGWKLAQALGDVPAGADRVEGNPVEQAERLIAELTRANAKLAAADAEMTQVLTERDEYHDGADKLAAVIAEITNSDIGEHSNMNDPWQNALDVGRMHLVKLANASSLAVPAAPVPAPAEYLSVEGVPYRLVTEEETYYATYRRMSDLPPYRIDQPLLRIEPAGIAITRDLAERMAAGLAADEPTPEQLARFQEHPTPTAVLPPLPTRTRTTAADAMGADGWPVECQRPCRRPSTATPGSVELCDPWHGQPDPVVADAAAALRDDRLCSDKNGFHDEHLWAPDPCDDLIWCPGYPVPIRTTPAAAGTDAGGEQTS